MKKDESAKAHVDILKKRVKTRLLKRALHLRSQLADIREEMVALEGEIIASSSLEERVTFVGIVDGTEPPEDRVVHMMTWLFEDLDQDQQMKIRDTLKPQQLTALAQILSMCENRKLKFAKNVMREPV